MSPDLWDGCATCGHYRGEHVEDGSACRCEVLGLLGTWATCGCEEFS